ncbi:energy transducer TonB [Novosphingobium resinovorum]|uniref:energy transducer TonB n=1 Tax=Novosphingobium resinovorum TaxID=158500 RepID=UPI002ED31869|nr:energy transducer TonB [Novosphingobium resinovorum]
MQVKSAALAAGVHGLALLLAWAGWQDTSAGLVEAERGQHLTTIALTSSAPDTPRPQSKAQSKAETAPSERPRIAEVTPQSRAALTPASSQPVRLVLSEQQSAAAAATIVPPAPGQVPAKSAHADDAAGSQSASATRSDAQPSTSSTSAEAAPARAGKGADTYALRVFRHIRAAKEFPAHLARTGMQGRVLVRFDITPGGEATGVAIARSSGVAVLDALALEQIRAAVPYPRPPRQLQAAHLHFIVPMTYRPTS